MILSTIKVICVIDVYLIYYCIKKKGKKIRYSSSSWCAGTGANYGGFRGIGNNLLNIRI